MFTTLIACLAFIVGAMGDADTHALARVDGLLPFSRDAVLDHANSCRSRVMRDHFGDLVGCQGASYDAFKMFYWHLLACVHESRGAGNVPDESYWRMFTRAVAGQTRGAVDWISVNGNLPGLYVRFARDCQGIFSQEKTDLLLRDILSHLDEADAKRQSEHREELADAQRKHDDLVGEHNQTQLAIQKNHEKELADSDRKHDALMMKLNQTQDTLGEVRAELQRAMHVALSLAGGAKPWPMWVALGAYFRERTRKENRMASVAYDRVLLAPLAVRMYQVGPFDVLRYEGVNATAPLNDVPDTMTEWVQYVGEQALTQLSDAIDIRKHTVPPVLDALVALASAFVLMLNLVGFAREKLGDVLDIAKKTRGK